MNKSFFYIILLIPFFLFSQTEEINLFEKKILQQKVIEFKGEINFVKAHSFYLKKEWDSTLVYSMKQLSKGNIKNLSDYCHYFRGTSFFNKKLYKEAQKEFLLISKTFDLLPIKNLTLGATLLELREFKKALTYYIQSEKQFIKLNKTSYLADVYNGIGTTYIFLKQYNEAEFFLFKNLNLNLKTHNKVKICTSYINLANLYYEQYKDNLAIFYFKKSYDLSKKINDFDIKRKTSKNMAVVEENRSNFKEALAYRKESEQWKDSLNNQSKVWALADYEKKYAVAQKQKQISVLKVENKLKDTQRNGLFYSVLALLLLLIGGVYVYAQKVKNSKIILTQKNKLDELNATKDQLFSIVSHDLRSSVNALKTSNTKLTASLETKNYSELDQLLHQNSAIANSAYSLLDNLLHWALLQTKQLYFHKDSVHLYSIVQQIEYNYKPLLLDKAITFENAVSKNSFIFVDLDSLKIVLRNLLDNAIKFSQENGEIKIYTVETNTDFCQLVIQDNGLGMSQDTINELLEDNELLAKKSNSEIIGTGLGLQLSKQMIKKNRGMLAIESESNKGTKIILTLPKTEQNG
ncbi:histidine kinase/DNA gyrase B/HSP90-like ATPase [Flavobacterium sp. 103]|uniref:tetratricopeptide repeat-containing sensor histidine kinase n=1 Tax=Flavobacterium sp. 103 TaxID=2135624 RepID=UPI000D5EDD32|nr:tetratricopeptide repeat-containing sensor histidine kinase [Flavobacterium sp. 103]PVX45210.1 histidine kinase/DNA gyrase B/HSP90-like ATPase [Flavobacterium sp. 103]